MPPRREKFYCGMKPNLPPGYDRFGVPFECLKKGFGACLYAGKQGTGQDRVAVTTPLSFLGRNWWWMLILLLLVVILSLLIVFRKR